MIQNEIRQRLFWLCDPDYRDFQSKLIPTVGIDSVIGVRTPDLRNYAKELSKREDICEFLNALPHDHFDENQLHAFIISLTKDYAKCLEQVKVFLPYVDNWATCDQMSPKVFKRHKSELIPEIRSWIASGKTYTVRFGIKLLMEHFLGDDFDIEYARAVAEIDSDEYYVKMMIAWYFATALAKQYESAIGFIERGTLEPWTHNKAIQKAVESFRVAPERKEYLKTLRRK